MSEPEPVESGGLEGLEDVALKIFIDVTANVYLTIKKKLNFIILAGGKS